ncbi:hypothetical protein L7F22_020676 [Adiantum nelumboides]|nr:hypothetical protein [Adiantum nelumboides]
MAAAKASVVRSSEAFVILLWIFLCCKAAMIWLWGINLRVFSASKISYAKVFDLDGTHLTSREIWKIALWITLIVLTSMTSFLYFPAHNSYLAASQPCSPSHAALKYATSFPVILLSALKYHVALEVWHGVHRPLWLISGLVNTCFSFYWDTRRDWDLNFFSSLCNLKYPVLRPNLLYSNHSVYYGAIGTNLLLRWAWTYKLSAHLRHNYITVFLMTALEMLRRFQWIFFRVESEWSKMSRSNLQTSAADSVKDAEVLIPLAEYNV